MPAPAPAAIISVKEATRQQGLAMAQQLLAHSCQGRNFFAPDITQEEAIQIMTGEFAGHSEAIAITASSIQAALKTS